MFCGFLNAWGFIEPYFEAYLTSMAHGSDPVSIQIGVIIIFVCFPMEKLNIYSNCAMDLADWLCFNNIEWSI